MVCHGQHTYLYAQVMLQILAQEPRGGLNVKRLQQEITRYAVNRWQSLLAFHLDLGTHARILKQTCRKIEFHCVLLLCCVAVATMLRPSNWLWAVPMWTLEWPWLLLQCSPGMLSTLQISPSCTNSIPAMNHHHLSSSGYHNFWVSGCWIAETLSK